jgi:hypothetical protein
MKERLLSAIESPKNLEALYRENPKEFKQFFPEIYGRFPNSIILQVWNERLISDNANESQTSNMWSYKHILLIVLLSLVAGTLLRLPIIAEDAIDPEWFFTRNLGGILIVPLMIYFSYQRSQDRRTVTASFVIVAGVLIFLNLLPFEFNGSSWEFRDKYRSFDDAITVAEIHIPLFLWLMFGVLYAGRTWMNSTNRMNFLRYNGEIIVYATIIFLSGMVLSGITLSLLSLIEKTYELTEWYGMNIIPYGVAAIPLVASFLIDKVIGRRFNIAPTLGKIFAPLFLITTIAYLVLMIVYKQSPYNDRDSLIIFNVLLIVVLGLLMFSVAERDTNAAVGLNDYINLGLVITTLILDVVVLSAVVFRMTNDIYGLTPNRTAILGINLLVFGHLVGILYHYARFVLNKNVFLNLENWIARYLPAYAVWSLGISIALPLIFWYK